MVLRKKHPGVLWCHLFQGNYFAKMPILKDHVIQWLSRWKIGAGGQRSIHAHKMKLERLYQGIANEVDHLKYIFELYQLKTTCGSETPFHKENQAANTYFKTST